MKTIINVPSDEKVYEVHVFYNKDDDTFDVNKYRVFAFEYMSIYHTHKGEICGTKSQFLSPISTAIVNDDEHYEYSGIMNEDGKIHIYSAIFQNLEEFKQHVKSMSTA